MSAWTPFRVLIFAPQASHVPAYAETLSAAGCEVEFDHLTDPQQLETLPRRGIWRAVLIEQDLIELDATAIDQLRTACQGNPPIIVLAERVTTTATKQVLDTGIAVMVRGEDPEEVGSAILRAIRYECYRQQHDADLRQVAASKRRFATLFNASPIATIVTEIEDGAIVDANPAAERLANKTRDEIIGQRTIDFGAWSDLPQRRRLVGDALFSGSRHTIEREVDLPGAPNCTLLVSFSAFEFEGKNRLLVMMQDISHRKAAEESVRESEARYRLLVENSHDLICELDDQGVLCYVSPNHQAVTGYLPDEMEGKRIHDLAHPDDIDDIDALLSQLDHRAQLRLRIRHRKEHWLTLDSAVQVHRAPDGSRRAVVISRDITASLKADADRAQLEQQLRQAQKMEAIGTLAGGIAHDFNNILTAIFGYLQLVQLETPDDSPIREELAGALEASERARDLVSQILTFSRRREQQRALGQVSPIINDAVRLLRASLPATIDFKIEIDETAPPILCDGTQLHQVIMNLGTNAGHAMNAHGGLLTLRLTKGEAEPSLYASYPQLANRQTLCLSVSDTGTGMDAATRERIFEPFFTTKPSNEGTGLGLAVVHGIVQDHDGAIVCESEPGIGTSFRVYFPTVDPASLDVAVTPTDLPKGNGERVLLVDDEESVVNIGSRMIKRLGYEVEAFTLSSKALERFTAAPRQFDIVVTDLTMGGITGVDIARRVFELRPGLPLIIATGFMNARDIDTARALGVKWFLEKPFSFQGLASFMQKALKHAQR
ncbi:PAS domain-containing sensor histidine kinase [Actomonas aquatica]|uniref:histidine kinase n=1 Tax=Actomonas aquatica TaxID=2866162 RepID=A0ABZ1C6S6_9BACT|nr:PAS domain-containing sensor histidine kinase [Opitutus sp. WL0086]WRQ87216.1 PAS domain S-box protein [Opitutus sp. WL0086]